MKKISFFIVAALFAVSAGFVSCSDDTEDDPFSNPTIEVMLSTTGSAATKLTSGNEISDKEEGTALEFAIKFSMSADKLAKISIVSSIASKNYTVIDSTLNQGIFNSGDKSITYLYKTNVGSIDEALTFKTVDTKDRVGTFTVTIKPKDKAAVDGFVTSSVTLLGGQSHAEIGSFYSIATRKVLTIGAAKSQPGDVDFAYFFGSTNKSTICGPSDTDGQTISYGSTKMSSWTTKNDTRFAVVTENASGVPSTWWDGAMALLDGTTQTKANNLEVGALIAYKTKAGTKGAFRVTSVSGQQAGSISITLIDKVTP